MGNDLNFNVINHASFHCVVFIHYNLVHLAFGNLEGYLMVGFYRLEKASMYLESFASGSVGALFYLIE